MPRYAKDKGDVILDTRTGLEWYVGPDKDTDYYEAEEWVKSLTVAGGGWRLPTRKELSTLYEENKGTRNMDPVYGTTGWWVWSTSFEDDSSNAWYFNFYRGLEDRSPRFRAYSCGHRAFAVRSGR